MVDLGRHGPKTRTACLTCKKRRVKCDEGQPTCSRCTKAGRICEGYQLALIDAGRPSLSRVTQFTTIGTSSMLLSPFSATEQEWRAYGLYNQKVALALSGPFDGDLWRSLFVQIANTEATVRLAIFALGNLIRHSESEESSHISDCLCKHCRQALRCYNKSIASFSDYLQQTVTDNSITIALVSCILFICIEFYRTNDKNAIALIEKGNSILLQASQANAGIQTHRVHPRIQALFDRLQVIIGLFGDDAARRKPDTPVLRISPPLTFESVEPARDMLQHLIDTARTLRAHAFQARSHDVNTPEFHNSLEAVRQEQKNAQSKMESWYHAYHSLKMSDPMSSKAPLAGLLLEAHYLIAKIYVDAALETSQDIYDGCSDQFKHLVKAAEDGVLYVPTDERLLDFSFESGFLGPLYLGALVCREPEIRRKMIRLMHQTNAKEGLWHRGEAICVATRVMDIEEGRSEIIPTGSRLAPPRFIDVRCGLNYRNFGALSVDVTYLLHDEGSQNPWQMLQETLRIT